MHCTDPDNRDVVEFWKLVTDLGGPIKLRWPKTENHKLHCWLIFWINQLNLDFLLKFLVAYLGQQNAEQGGPEVKSGGHEC